MQLKIMSNKEIYLPEPAPRAGTVVINGKHFKQNDQGRGS
jgi:hypothetical protein